MRKIVILAMLAFATPALATELTTDMTLGTTIPEVEATLTELVYEVRKTEMEDGNIEAYFVKGNKMGEAYVSTSSGKVIKLKMK